MRKVLLVGMNSENFHSDLQLNAALRGPLINFRSPFLLSAMGNYDIILVPI